MSKDLYVKNIATETTEEELRKLFAVCGKVSYVHMVKDARTSQFLGCAYIKMSSDEEARDAVRSLDGARLVNRLISVTEALPQRPKGGPAAPKEPKSPEGQRTARGGPPRSHERAGVKKKR